MKSNNINVIKHTVKSNSSNKEYLVLQENDKFICDCRGFEIKHECKHISEIQNKILFFKEKEELKQDIENKVKVFISKYNMIPKISVSKSAQVSVKFIF